MKPRVAEFQEEESRLREAKQWKDGRLCETFMSQLKLQLTSDDENLTPASPASISAALWRKLLEVFWQFQII